MLTPPGQDELLDEPARAASKRRSKRSPSDLTVRITSTVFDQHSTFPSSPSLDVIIPTITRAYDARTRWLLAQLTTPDSDRATSPGSPLPSEPLVHLPRLSSRPPQVGEDDDSPNSSQSGDFGSDDDSESDHDGLHVDNAPEELLSPAAPSSLSPTSLAQRAEPPAPTELPPLRHTSRPSTPARNEQAQTIIRLQEGLKQRDAQLAASLEREAILQSHVDTAQEERDCARKEAGESEGAANLWKSRFLDLLSEQADDHLRDLEEGPGSKLDIISANLDALQAEHRALLISPYSPDPTTTTTSSSLSPVVTTFDNIATRLSDTQSSFITWQTDYAHLLSTPLPSPPSSSAFAPTPTPTPTSTAPPSRISTRSSRLIPTRRTRSFNLTDLTKRVSYVGTRFAWVRDDLQATIASLRAQLDQAQTSLVAAQVAAPQTQVTSASKDVLEPLLAPYEALFFALEAAEVNLEEGDKEGVERAVKRAREKLRAMGPLWEEVERRRGLL